MAGSVGAAIRRARNMAGLTQDQLAEKVGVSRRALGEWETTGKVSGDRLQQLVAVLGDDLAELLSRPSAGAPIEIVIDGTRLVVHPNPAYTPEQVQAMAPAILAAALRGIAEATSNAAESVTAKEVGNPADSPVAD